MDHQKIKSWIDIDHNRSQSQCLPLHENADLHGRENLAGYSVWFVATLIPEENRFVSWLTPPNNPPNTFFLWKSLFFASCLDLIEVGAFMRFNDPLRTHVFGPAPNKRKPCIPSWERSHISLLPRQIEVDDLFPFSVYIVGYGLVCSLEASFSWDVFVFVFFTGCCSFSLFFP